MNEVLMNVWLAFNIVFGLWSGRNFAIRFWTLITNDRYQQSDLGKILDLLVLVSILAYYFTVNTI
jgi:hypothetical protein